MDLSDAQVSLFIVDTTGPDEPTYSEDLMCDPLPAVKRSSPLSVLMLSKETQVALSAPVRDHV